MENPFLIGDKVYLRPIEPDDGPRLRRWFNDYEVRRATSRHRPMHAAAQEEWMKNMQSRGDVVLMIVVRGTDETVGMTGLHEIDPRHRRATYGIAIGEKNEWNKGYGTEAARLLVGYGFDTLNLHKVCLDAFADNARAIHSYEKLGFRHEGLFREHFFRDGRYCDGVVMGVLRNEWGKTVA